MTMILTQGSQARGWPAYHLSNRVVLGCSLQTWREGAYTWQEVRACIYPHSEFRFRTIQMRLVAMARIEPLVVV